MQASVVICAVGRNRLLPWIIRGAVTQTVRPDEYEVIVVEGESAGSPNPLDGDSDVWRIVCSQSLTSPVKIRYLFVPGPRPGNLMRAARRAAHGQCLVLLPSDRVIGVDWLADTLYGAATAVPTPIRLAE